MASQRSITELALRIQENASAVESGAKNMPGAGFSLDFGAPPMVRLSPDLEARRVELVEMADELKTRLLGPIGFLTHMVLPVPVLTIILSTMYAYDIAAHVPINGEPITYADLATRCGLSEDDTRRICQAAASFRIFTEASPDVSIRHNAISAPFAAMKDIFGLIVEEQCAGASKYVESLRRFPNSGEPGHAALMLASRAQAGQRPDEEIGDPSKGFFDFIADDEARVARFRRAMGKASASPAFSPQHFVHALPWADVTKAPRSIVDVGGAGGEVSIALLREYPAIESAVSLDLPEVIAGISPPSDLTDRLTFASYNFITQSMERKVDAYVLRHIFHDWSDKYASKILQNLVPALRKGTRVWINEVVLPDLSETHHISDQRQRSADLLMKQGFNGKERSRKGWESLLAEADGRYRIGTITQPEGAQDAVIEAVFDG
ncbi:S-adenosyl-L-methionine-dependent methyltransferase [Xylariaceae sp. FL0016]|nr:S-adenosyl-L-methionine-dependent methyltransferase [Xylariaceae sp. FL0016]